jgi:hypothetical protein
MSVPLDMHWIFQPTSAEYPEHFTNSPSIPPSDIDLASSPPSSPQSSSLPSVHPSSSIADFTQLTDSAHALIADVQKKVSLWNADWGPIHQWPRLFETKFGDAKEKECSDDWVENIQLVVENGWKIAHQLRQAVEGNLPSNDWMVRDLWRSSLSLMADLLEGITVLETRLEIVAPFPHQSLGRSQYSQDK